MASCTGRGDVTHAAAAHLLTGPCDWNKGARTHGVEDLETLREESHLQHATQNAVSHNSINSP